MNILMISGDISVAQGRQGAFHNTLDEFSKYWAKVDIIVPHIAGVSRYDCFSNVTLYPSPWPKVLQPLFIWNIGRKLALERKYDIIVSHDYGMFLNGIGASMLASRLGVPCVSEIHHVNGYPRNATQRERIQPWLTQYYVRRVQSDVKGFRITNDTELRPLLKSWGVPEDRIIMLYSLYLDFNIFHPEDTRHDFDAIFCGRLSPNKAPFLFLDGLAHARKQLGDVRALIIGQGSLASRLYRRAADLGLQSSIDFIGWVTTPDELASLYRRSRCLVCTSLSEGGPRVVAEALACGVPVITTRVGLATELVQDGVNGFQIDWSAQEMANRLVQISSNQELQLRLSKTAPDAVRRFEKSRVIREYALGYQRLATR